LTFIEGYLAEAIGRAEAGSRDYLITLEALSDPRKWLQLRWDSINAAYPRSTDPTLWLQEHAASVPPYVAVADWSAGEFVTFSHGAERLDALGRFVELYARDVLALEPTERAFAVERSE
jgi:hypothetical protein